MKNKKIIIIFSVLLIAILIGGFFAIKYVRNKQKEISVQEYTPQEEIAEEQVRQTIVSLYFISKETNEISPEARFIDIKEIITNPYDKLVNLLIEGPKNEKLKGIIPNDTKILKIYLNGDCIVLDLSKEFLNYSKENEKDKENIINSIVNTLTELTEINHVKILIEGNQVEDFSEIYSRATN